MDLATVQIHCADAFAWLQAHFLQQQLHGGSWRMHIPAPKSAPAHGQSTHLHAPPACPHRLCTKERKRIHPREQLARSGRRARTPPLSLKGTHSPTHPCMHPPLRVPHPFPGVPVVGVAIWMEKGVHDKLPWSKGTRDQQPIPFDQGSLSCTPSSIQTATPTTGTPGNG